MAELIDYGNFKSEVGKQPSQRDKIPAYHKVWAAMERLQKYVPDSSVLRTVLDPSTRQREIPDSESGRRESRGFHCQIFA